MELIRILMSLIVGLFPRLFHQAAIPLATVPQNSSHGEIQQFALELQWFGWYRVTIEFRPTRFPQLKVIEVISWDDQPFPNRDKPNGRL